jgi:hypothetical protein
LTVAEELLKTVGGGNGDGRTKPVTRLIQDILVATMMTSRLTYGNRFPLWIRKRALRLLSKLKTRLLDPKCVAVCVLPELLIVRAVMDFVA